MALRRLKQALIGTACVLLPASSSAQRPADLTAVLIQIERQVTLSAESRAEFRPARRAASHQVIRQGETVHVPAGGRAVLICSTETLITLQGPKDWLLDAPACERGIAVPASSYRDSAPKAGRILPGKGGQLVELETRTGNKEDDPVLLSPRDTAVLDPRPLLVWTRVPEAFEYQIDVEGPVGASIRPAAGDLRCGPGSGPWHGLEICSWKPSAAWPLLKPQIAVFLNIGFRKTPGAQLRQARKSRKIRLLPENEQSLLREKLRQIASLPMDRTNRLLLTAGAYTQGGLYADAIGMYDEALNVQEIPEVRVTLGDLYLTIRLAALAGREYRQVLAGSPDSVVQAAATFGLGRVAYFDKSFSEARTLFERSLQLYATLGLSEEADAARSAAASAQARSKNGSP